MVNWRSGIYQAVFTFDVRSPVTRKRKYVGREEEMRMFVICVMVVVMIDQATQRGCAAVNNTADGRYFFRRFFSRSGILSNAGCIYFTIVVDQRQKDDNPLITGRGSMFEPL